MDVREACGAASAFAWLLIAPLAIGFFFVCSKMKVWKRRKAGPCSGMEDKN
ncbi:hypothetical protein TGS27_0557 [Geobacillus stearothermophilus]|uniref:Uncharacterized protein n=1 Tax=Geobacillus stearothermophilus TaxID=1422 RepID=A0A150MKY3_GEOSE|nr:hypothetical protein GS8_1864 [Geobacillus stearothermophilus]KYD24942.1 hypothetical protein B4109_1797 [Geobacillus stearothermophilus]OAO86060.1 hypothetical protein TGS27_0557 [Geobacillus stearothermophilus]